MRTCKYEDCGRELPASGVGRRRDFCDNNGECKRAYHRAKSKPRVTVRQELYGEKEYTVVADARRKPGPKGSRNDLDIRRNRARQMHSAGESDAAIATALGVSKSMARRYYRDDSPPETEASEAEKLASEIRRNAHVAGIFQDYDDVRGGGADVAENWVLARELVESASEYAETVYAGDEVHLDLARMSREATARAEDVDHAHRRRVWLIKLSAEHRHQADAFLARFDQAREALSLAPSLLAPIERVLREHRLDLEVLTGKMVRSLPRHYRQPVEPVVMTNSY